jgi:NifU-like protein involved in Fe-S cluster formation
MAMRTILAALAAAALGGCGVETASTAATAAALKKQEIEQGRKTMDQMQKSINQTMEQGAQRAGAAAGEEK